MDDISVIIILFVLMNRNGLTQIKSAIKTAENISNGIENISGLMNMLPQMQSIIGGLSENSESTNYIDTLKDVIENISGK